MAKDIYLDTNLWNVLCDQAVDSAQLVSRLAAKNAYLAPGTHIFYEMAKTFRSSAVGSRERGGVLFSYFRQCFEADTHCVKDNMELLAREMWSAKLGSSVSGRMLSQEDRDLVLQEVDKLIAGELSQRASEFLDNQSAFASSTRLNQHKYLTEEDYSWIWRSQIEIEGHGDPKDSLVSAVRDAAVLVAALDPAKIPALLNNLTSRRWRIFRRIAAHALRTSPNVEPAAMKELLAGSFDLQDYPQTEPELADFLERSFSKLPDEIQRYILAIIDAGPNLDTFKKNFETEKKRAPSGEDIENIGQQWKLQWLQPIHESLPTDAWRNHYQELIKRFGRPAEVSHQWAGVFVGPTSPKAMQELRELEPETLIDYLQTWVPSGEWASPTPSGLGRELISLVSTEPEKFSKMAAKFIGLDRTYVSSAIEGFSDAIKKGRAIDWPEVLNLCEWVVKQNAENGEPKIDLFHGDPDWIASRIAVARLLREGFAAPKASQPPNRLLKNSGNCVTERCAVRLIRHARNRSAARTCF